MCINWDVDGDEDDEVKDNRRKKKMMKKMIVQELRDEYLDIPEEVNVSHMTCHTHFIMSRDLPHPLYVT